MHQAQRLRSWHQATLPFLREAGSHPQKELAFPSNHQQLPLSRCISACLRRKPGYYCWSGAAVNVARLDNNYNHINNSNINKSNYKQQTANSGSVSRRRLIYTSLVLAAFSKVPAGLAVPEPRQQHSGLGSPAASQQSPGSTFFSATGAPR